MNKRANKYRTWDGLRMTTSGIMFNTTTGEVEAADNMSLMQFTGLLDKNGVEIYEGDVVTDNTYGTHSLVRFSTEDVRSCGCCYGRFAGSGMIADDVIMHDCIVIGNVYENPELLEQTK